MQILGLLGTLMDSGVLIPGLALCFGLYMAYLIISARHDAPMTKEEAETLWKFHKTKTCCKAEIWHEITKKNKLIGYECDCGFKQTQKKPIINLK